MANPFNDVPLEHQPTSLFPNTLIGVHGTLPDVYSFLGSGAITDNHPGYSYNADGETYFHYYGDNVFLFGAFAYCHQTDFGMGVQTQSHLNGLFIDALTSQWNSLPEWQKDLSNVPLGAVIQDTIGGNSAMHVTVGIMGATERDYNLITGSQIDQGVETIDQVQFLYSF